MSASTAAFPRHFSAGDELLCWCLHGKQWQLAKVIAVYRADYNPALAPIGRRDARKRQQHQQPRLKQIRVHFTGQTRDAAHRADGQHGQRQRHMS